MAYADDRAVRLVPVIISFSLQSSGSNMDSFFHHQELATKKEKERSATPRAYACETSYRD
jgi:hypothetical protein